MIEASVVAAEVSVVTMAVMDGQAGIHDANCRKGQRVNS